MRALCAIAVSFETGVVVIYRLLTWIPVQGYNS